MALTQLPNEVLEQILQYLNISDKAVLSRSCRALNGAHGNPPTLVTIGKNTTRIMSSLRANNCYIEKYVFDAADFPQEQNRLEFWKDFWTEMGVYVTCLEFRKCDVSENTFASAIYRCPNLTALTIDDCKSLLMSGKLLDTRFMDVPLSFHSITHLEIVNTSYLSDALFNRMVGYSKCLIKLSLAGCNISFHSAIFKRFYPSDGSILASESVLTFQNILKCLEKHARSLKCLDFSQTLVDNQALSSVSQVPGLCLDHIYLTNCCQLSTQGFATLSHFQPQLQILNIKRSAKISDQVLDFVTSNLTQLDSLNISECNKVTDNSFSSLKNLTKIADLDVSACGLVSSMGLERAFCTSNMKYLTSLNISACSLTEQAIVNITSHSLSLRHLDMSNCCDGVTDVALQAVILNLRWLRSLHLAWCKNITDYGLTGRHYKLPSISSTPSPASSPTSSYPSSENDWMYREMNNQNIQIDNSIENSESSGVCLSRLAGLFSLDLCGCLLISDISLKVAVRFRELKSLNISLCEKITDNGIISVGAFNNSLESLKMSQCRHLTDFGVVTLIRSLPRLKHLDVQGCQKIGNASIDAVGNFCRSLRSLDVSICPSISAQTLLNLEEKMENLQLNQRQLRTSEFGGILFRTSTFSKIIG